MGARTLDIAMAIVVVAGLFVLVRPGSQGTKLVTSLTSGFTNSIKAATGGGGWSH